MRLLAGRSAGQNDLAPIHRKLYLASRRLSFPPAGFARRAARTRSGRGCAGWPVPRAVDPDRRHGVFHHAGHLRRDRGLFLRCQFAFHAACRSAIPLDWDGAHSGGCFGCGWRPGGGPAPSRDEYSKVSLRFIDGGTVPAAEKIPYHRLVPGMWPQSIVSASSPPVSTGSSAAKNTSLFYVGVFPFFLAITAIWKCWDNVWVRYLTGLAVLAFAYSLGALFSSSRRALCGCPVSVAGPVGRPVPLPLFVRPRDSRRLRFGCPARSGQRGAASWEPANRILKWVAIAAAAALFLPAIFTQLNLGIWSALSLLLILGSCGWFVRLTC